MRLTFGVVLVGLLSCVSPRAVAAAERDSRLADAVSARAGVVVQRLLSERADVNGRQPDGTTALAWAAHWDDGATADSLIKAGADVNAANDLGVTPLALACVNGSVSMGTRLLAAGADPNRARKTGETPLMTAAFTGNIDLVRALLSHKADVNAAAAESKQTALMFAVAERHTAVVRALVAAGADVRARSAGGFSPILFASRQGDVDSAAALLDAGADSNDKARDGNSALAIAVASGREEVALLLLDRGADPNAAHAGFAPLHVAVSRSLLGALKALLAHGADPNVRLKTAPATLFGPGKGAGSEVPAAAGPDSTPSMSAAGSFAGATPFWLAAKNVNVAAMRLLRDAGADVHLPNGEGTTPLMASAGLTQVQGPRARRGDVSQFYSNWGEADALEAVMFLLDAGADVHAKNASNQTALHGAAYMGGNTIVELLLDRGARVDVQDGQGQTPYRLAEGHLNVASQGVTEWPETAALLRKRGANTTLGVDGRTMLRQYVTLKDGSAPAPPR